jgi:class 3 adenylate cyclase/tetratricopeptide (TPR) repeat protein
MICRKCQKEKLEGKKFCRECGTKLVPACPKCGSENIPGDKFCGECGSHLKQTEEAPHFNYQDPQSYTPKHLAEKILTSRSAIEGERKLVTVLFADVAGFTSMSEKLDPEDVHRIMDGCFHILMEEIHKYEGTVNEFRGDGLMALFGAPIAHEDHAQRACYAALNIQKALATYQEKLKQAYGIDFKMRIGLNSGTLVVGTIGDDLRMDYTALGDTANLAARIETLAAPGSVLLSSNTFRLVQDYFECLAKGKTMVKGKEEPQESYELVRAKEIETRLEASAARGLTELVGRHPEMEFLRAAFARVIDGEAQIVDLVGEAGVGKSRLTYEFRKSLGDRVTFFTGRCVNYGRNVNYLPVTDLFKTFFGVEEGLNEAEIGDRIARNTPEGLETTVPFIRNLLSLKVENPAFTMLDAEGRKYATFEAVKELLIHLSNPKPLVVFLEDVHWMDRISEDLFSFFSRCLHGNRILMLSAYRPEGSPRWARGAQGYHQLVLETLSSGSSVQLVRNILGGLPLEQALEQRIVKKTGGNPFFVEEIVRELIDRGDIARIGDSYRSSRSIEALRIPDTIQGVLAARMDRLNEDLKRTMQVASVIGRDFAFRILKSIMELGEDLRVQLTNLVGLEIIYEKALYPELEYIFKHALTQEVAYDSLLKQRRQEIHGRIAQTIEQIYGDRLEEHYEILSHHYERSANSPKAVDYLLLAAEKSNRKGAVQAAFEFSGRAIDLAESTGLKLHPKVQGRLYDQRARASGHIGDMDGSIASFRKVVALSREYNLPKEERKALRGMVNTFIVSPDKDESLRQIEEIRVWASERGDKSLESLALTNIGLWYGSYGNPVMGLELTSKAEQLALSVGEPLPVFFVRFIRAVLERWLGGPTKTVELTEGIVELLQMRFGLSTLPAAIQIRGIALAEIGRINEAMETIKKGIELCERFGATYRLGALSNCLGYCYGELYQHEQALGYNLEGEKRARGFIDKSIIGSVHHSEILAQSIINCLENLYFQGNLDSTWKRLVSFKQESRGRTFDLVRHQWEGRMNLLAAQVQLSRNEIGEAEKVIRETLEKVKQNQSKKREGSLLRLLGEVNLRRNNHDQATAHIGEAIEILQKVGNPRQLWEAQAALGRTFEQLGRHSEAKEQWVAAATAIQRVASGLSDQELKKSFLNAQPVREILARAER